MGKQLKDHPKLTHKMGRDIYGMQIDSFKCFQHIRTTVPLEGIQIESGDEIRIPFELVNTYGHSLNFEKFVLLECSKIEGKKSSNNSSWIYLI